MKEVPKENFNDLKQTLNFPQKEKLSCEIKSCLLPIQKTQQYIRKTSSNRKSEDINYLKMEKNTNVFSKSNINSTKSSNYFKTTHCKVDINQDLKTENKPSHNRVLSNIESSMQKPYNINYYSKFKLIKQNSLSKNSMNNNSKNSTPTHNEQKKIVLNTENLKKQHKFTKSELNSKIVSLGSPKTNKELKYFYKAKNFIVSPNSKIVNNCIRTQKNSSDLRSYDEFKRNNLISPKNPKQSIDLNRESIFIFEFL